MIMKFSPRKLAKSMHKIRGRYKKKMSSQTSSSLSLIYSGLQQWIVGSELRGREGVACLLGKSARFLFHRMQMMLAIC